MKRIEETEGIPEMGRLAELAIKLRMPLRDLVVGRMEHLPDTLDGTMLGLQAREKAGPRPDEKREALRAMMAADPHVSIREMALILGISHRDVYHLLENEVRLHSQDRMGRQLEAMNASLSAAERAVVDRLKRTKGELFEVTVRELRRLAANSLAGKSYSAHQQVVNRAMHRSSAD